MFDELRGVEEPVTARILNQPGVLSGPGCVEAGQGLAIRRGELRFVVAEGLGALGFQSEDDTVLDEEVKRGGAAESGGALASGASRCRSPDQDAPPSGTGSALSRNGAKWLAASSADEWAARNFARPSAPFWLELRSTLAA